LISFHFHVNFPSEVTWISKYTLYYGQAAAEDRSPTFSPAVATSTSGLSGPSMM